MPPATRSQRRRSPPIAMLGTLGALLLFVALARLWLGGSAIALGVTLATSAVLLGAWAASPSWLVGPAAWVHRALESLGAAVGAVVLTLVYVSVVWPYAALVRRLGLVEPPHEAWPPPKGTSAWRPVDWSPEGNLPRRARPGRLLARSAVALDGVLALFGLLGRRAIVVLPIAALLLAIALLALFGSATGLGPLVYTLF